MKDDVRPGSTPKVYSTELGGQTIENRIMTHRGVTVGWDAGSADQVLAFVDSLSEDEAANLKLVQFESDFAGGGPVIQALWKTPPPWRFRNDGQIPPKIGGGYPSLLDSEGRVWKQRH